MSSDIYFDPKCECDAPKFVDFTNMTSMYEDNADDWFDHRVDMDIAESVLQNNTKSSSQCNESEDENNAVDSSESHSQVEIKSERIKDSDSGNTTRPASVRKAVKSTEERQMEEIKRLQVEARKRLKASRRSFHRLAKGSQQIKAVKGSKRPTQIKEFHFSKAKNKGHSIIGNADGPIDFAKTLRSVHQSDNYDSMAPKKPPTPEPVTQPKPFKFELDKRPGLKSSGAACSKTDVPIAEFITKFETATPPRFRRTPTNHRAITGCIKDKVDYSLGSHLTNPKTPKLLTKTRARPVEHKSIAEIEEEIASKMEQYQFKANPLNPDVIHKGGLLGIPRKRTNPSLTHPISPQLATKKLAMARKALHGEEDRPDYEAEDRRFIATPMPDFNEIKGLPAKQPHPVTQPESPVITKRLNKIKEEEDESHSIKANPMPSFEKVFAPQYPQRMIETQPFSFEERDKGKATRDALVEKIHQSEKKPTFKAQPLPSSTFHPSFVPTLDSSATKPSPFNLQTNIRGEHHSQKWKEQVDKLFQKEKEDADFKAGGVSAHLYSKPFAPERSTKPLTRVENVILHSEVRSNQRAKYECEKQKRLHLIETENLARRALREAKDAKDIAVYRKSLVHKAKPINHYAPVIVKPSSKPVTQPISPHFKIDLALKNKQFTK